MPKQIRIFFSLSIRIALTVCMFLLLFRPQVFGLRPDVFGGVTPQTMWEYLEDARLSVLVPWLVAACLVKLAGILLAVLRWRYALEGQGVGVPFLLLVRWWFVGRFLGVLVPGWLGLDPYRLYHTSRFAGDVLRPLTAIVAEKIIGFCVFGLLVLLASPLFLFHDEIDDWIPVLLAAGAALAVLLSCGMLIMPRTLQTVLLRMPAAGLVNRFVRRFGDAAARYEGRRALLAKAFAAGFASHLCTVGMYLCTIVAVREGGVPLVEILAAVPVVVGGIMLGPSIVGEGIREVLFAAALGDTGATAAVLYAHLAWWVGEVLPFLLGAPLFVLTVSPLPPDRNEAQDSRICPDN